jgi:RNA polymerase sigma-70 factor (ECF subfamily)
MVNIQDQSCSRPEGMDKLETRSDAELLQLALAGDESAFLLLYERLKRGIFRYAFYMTGSQSTAEEVTQEVFMSLLKQGKDYREERGDVGGFAFGIARNFVRRIARRERAYEPLSEKDALERVAPDADALPGQMIRNEVADSVQKAVASLPDHYRQVVVLCDLCEFSYSEAASRLECAVGTVRSRLNRGHALLRQKLKPLGKREADVSPAGAEGCLI